MKAKQETKIATNILIGFFTVLIVIVIIAFWHDDSKDVSKTDVAVQLAIDSIKSDYKNKLEQREDSIQRAALHRDSLWKIAYDDAQRKANKYEKENQKSARTIQELKAKYAEPCKEIIAEYDNRENNYIQTLQAEKVALTVCEKRVVEWKGIAASKEAQLTAANTLIQEKNKTISTQRDRITTITNRMDRNFIYRNWMWATGKFRKKVL